MEMLKTDVATFFPTACICGSQTAPFVDTGAEIYGAYHVYLCERCVTSAAEQLGFTRPSERAKLDELVDAQRAFIEELEAEVEEEQADKFVSLEVVQALLEAGPPGSTKVTPPKRPTRSAA